MTTQASKAILEFIGQTADGGLEYRQLQNKPEQKTSSSDSEINTDFKHRKLISKDLRHVLDYPDIRMSKRVVSGSFGQKPLRIANIFSRPGKLSWIDELKTGKVANYNKLLDDASAYIAKCAQESKFDLVLAAPSSKPLALDLATAIALRLDIPASKMKAAKTGIEAKKVHVSRRTDQKRFDWESPEARSEYKDLDILLVDDLTTTDSTMVQLATMLYEAKAKYVFCVALLGPARSKTESIMVENEHQVMTWEDDHYKVCLCPDTKVMSVGIKVGQGETVGGKAHTYSNLLSLSADLEAQIGLSSAIQMLTYYDVPKTSPLWDLNHSGLRK